MCYKLLWRKRTGSGDNTPLLIPMARNRIHYYGLVLYSASLGFLWGTLVTLISSSNKPTIDLICPNFVRLDRFYSTVSIVNTGAQPYKLETYMCTLILRNIVIDSDLGILGRNLSAPQK